MPLDESSEAVLAAMPPRPPRGTVPIEELRRGMGGCVPRQLMSLNADAGPATQSIAAFVVDLLHVMKDHHTELPAGTSQEWLDERALTDYSWASPGNPERHVQTKGMPEFPNIYRALQYSRPPTCVRRKPVPDPEPVHSVKDRTIPGPASQLPIRIYKPQAPEGRHLSALVYYHGGGFVMGGLQSHDGICRAIANRVPCIVVSVDYRLAPEHPFPAAVDDCLAAAEWVAANLETLGATSGKLAVGGDSAGANLAAVTAISARDRARPRFVHQLLVYPVVEVAQVNGEFLYESYRECPPGTKGLLDSSDAMWLTQLYLPSPEDATDPRFAVIRADHKGLPPATVITCEVDPLRDEGKAYAKKLQAAGVQVNSFHYKGTFHGFLGFPVPQAKEALDAIAAELCSAFSV